MKLRDYQRDAHASTLKTLGECDSALVVMPTGTGKTVLFATLSHDWHRDRNCRVLVLAHREELIFQAADTIEAVTGNRPAIEMGEISSSGPNALYPDSPILVSSVQTLCRPNRLGKFRPQDFGLVIVDEAHHCVPRNKSYNDIVNHFMGHDDCRMLGVTATPDRADEEALGQMFKQVAFEYGVVDAINDGYLVPVEQLFVRVEDINLEGVRTSFGDFTESDLSKVMGADRVIYEMAAATRDAAKGRPTLVFVPGRKKGDKEAGELSPMQKMAKAFNDLDPESAEFISGDESETPKDQRRSLIAKFKQGKLQRMVSCGVFLEGFDASNAAVIAMGRPTKSRSLYAQALGRGTRPLKGVIDGLDTPAERRAAIAASAKPCMTVLDFVGNSGKHKLVSAADVLGGKYSGEIVAAATEAAQKSGEAVDVLQTLAQAHEAEERRKQAELEERLRLQAQAEAKRAADYRQRQLEKEERKRREREKREAKLKAKVRYTAEQVDPFNLFDITPQHNPGWRGTVVATDKQRQYLLGAGIELAGSATLADAQQLCAEVTRRRQEKLCSFKQARMLVKRGYKGDTAELSGADASRMIAQLIDGTPVDRLFVPERVKPVQRPAPVAWRSLFETEVAPHCLPAEPTADLFSMFDTEVAHGVQPVCANETGGPT